jgi:diaminohydroxyphosphoribosylaminopyrimidine deaminase / 5-amino-6-(5-phosphoribosylamino)uracil reductase
MGDAMKIDGGPDPAAEALRRIRAADPARPFVLAQLGQSLDGRIATLSGESRYINGEAGLDHLHRLRAAVDAVVVGAGTIEADDPQLTVRRCAGNAPARVVIDPRGRLNGAGRWLAQDGARRVLVTSDASAAPAGVETIVLPSDGRAIAPHDIVMALHCLGFSRILIEGGARTISAFIDAGAVDRLHLIVACTIIGSGRPGLDLRPLERLRDALRPPTDLYRLDSGDILFDCDLRKTE